MYEIDVIRVSGCYMAVHGHKGVPQELAYQIKRKFGKRFVDVLAVLPRTSDALKVQCLVKAE
jgi:hypothetical protein